MTDVNVRTATAASPPRRRGSRSVAAQGRPELSVVAHRADLTLVGAPADAARPDIRAQDRPEVALAQVFAQLVRLARPASAESPDATADRVCAPVDDEAAADHRLRVAVRAVVRLAAAVPGEAVSAHLSLDAETNGPVSPLAEGTDAGAVLFAAAERDAGQGPSASARSRRATTVASDVTCDQRWPALAGRLAAGGYVNDPPSSGSGRPAGGPEGTKVGAVLAVPLVDADENVLGVLTFTRPTVGAFDPAWREHAAGFADAAGSILLALREAGAQQRLARQLSTALMSRAVIDQAKGVLMQRRGCDDRTAFNLLSQASQRANVKLRDVAQMLVEDTQPRRAGDAHTPRSVGQQAAGASLSGSRS